MEFKNKIVLITGAASGIGKEAAFLFAKEQATVIIADKDEQSGANLEMKIIENGGKARFIYVDVANKNSIDSMFETIIREYNHLDIAINNAGISGIPSRTTDINFDNFNAVMNINSTSIFVCMQHEIKQMLKQGKGVILNTSSIAGLRGLPNSLPYVASKHAVVGMTKTAAMEYARKNIRINAICPAFTVTNLFKPEFMDSISEGLSEKLKNQIPMKRFANAKEIAEVMLMICSDKASFITGQAIPVDGGVSA